LSYFDVVLRFGIFELDRGTGELRRNGRLIPLAAQPARVLSLLIARAGELVTREELQHALWGDETHVDFDAGISTCINQIRSALGDRAASARFIETVPRRGYRFIADVNVAEVNGSEHETELSRFWQGNMIAVVSLVAVIVVALLVIPIRARWNHKPIPIVVLPVNVESARTDLGPLSDSLNDVLTGALASEPGDRVRVASSKGLRDRHDDFTPEDIRRLGADYYIYVALRSIDTQVLVHMKLIELSGGWVVWTTDRVLPPDALERDQLRIAREVSRAIVQKLNSISN
jgi:DNA-binding winged helix-turn-helix (wHTH) protein/TolB-like protein